MESLLAIIIGVVSRKFIDRMKKWGIDAFDALLLFCCLAGTVYAIFKMWLPLNLQENILSFASTAGLAAVSTHEILKRLNPPKS